MDKVLNQKEAAKYLGISLSTLLRKEDVPRFKVGRRVLYRAKELDNWLEGKRVV